MVVKKLKDEVAEYKCLSSAMHNLEDNTELFLEYKKLGSYHSLVDQPPCESCIHLDKDRYRRRGLVEHSYGLS